MAQSLTVKRIGRLLRDKTQWGKRHRDGDTRGLYLQITPSGTASWILRYTGAEGERFHGLGPLDVVGLKEARVKAGWVKFGLLDGIDPIERKRDERAARALKKPVLTFEQAAQAWLAKHEAEWKHPKSAREFRSGFRAHVYPVIGKVAVEQVDTALVLKIVEPLWTTRTVKATRLLRQIAGILDWATVAGFRSGDNPARWRGYLSELLPNPSKINTTRNHPSLPYSELPSFMAELAQRSGPAARALELTILCATRSAETIGARWSEIDFENKLWIIPPERMKAGREHRIPLSDHAVELLRALPTEEGNDYVFIGPTSKGLSAQAMPAMLWRMHRRDITTHGMRSSFRNWCAERAAFPDHVAEMALGHAVGSGVERAYRRTDLLDKRRHLMQLWADYCYSSRQKATVSCRCVARRWGEMRAEFSHDKRMRDALAILGNGAEVRGALRHLGR